MTIRHLYPAVEPSLNLDFANSKKLDSRITFTRGSTATYTDESGIIRTAAANEARFDHDGDGNSLGLLIEESRTNLLTRSEEFNDGAAWGKTNVTVTANAAVAPDGTTTADKLSATTTNGIHSIFSAAISAGTYTFSVFAKKAEYDRIIVNYYGISFNLNTGVIESTLPWQYNTSAKIEKFADGWYRCFVTGTAAGNLYLSLANAAPAGNLSAPPSFAGDGTSGIYVWGAQLEAGSFPTSYIPTTSSTVTRSAEVVSMTGTNFSSWYNQSEGSFIIEHRHDGVDSDGYLFEIGGTSGNYAYSHAAHFIGSTSASGYQSRSYFYGYGYPSSLFYFTKSTPTKVFYGYKSGDYAAGADRVLSTTSQSSWNLLVLTVDNYLGLGRRRDGTRSFQQLHISRLTYYPTRLSNATLQALTL